MLAGCAAVPRGWEWVSLGDVATMQSGGTPPTSVSRFYGGDIPWASIADMTSVAKYLKKTDRSLSHAGLIGSSAHVLPAGTVLYAMYASLGECVIASEPMATSQAILGIQPGPKLNPEFLYYVLDSIRSEVRTKGQTGTQANLNKEMVQGFRIPLPPLPEQRAIAAALADADEWVASLDARIRKQQLLAVGMRQRLVHGLARLPGFNEQWADLAIGELLAIRHGRSQAQVATSAGPYPILATGGEIGRASEYLHPGPSVLIGRKGTIDRPQFMDTPFWSVDTLFYTEIGPGHDARFIYYLFCDIDWSRYNEASGVPSLNSTTIERIRVRVPPRAEQVAIAAVLHDIDTELADLRAKRRKADLIREGMVQALLSGDVRLPPTDQDRVA